MAATKPGSISRRSAGVVFAIARAAPEVHSTVKASCGEAKPGSAAAVGADGEGADAGGERRRRAGAAAAGGAGEVPGIAGDAGERRIAERLPAVFRRRRLAEQHGAVLAQPRHRRGILVPRLVALR